MSEPLTLVVLAAGLGSRFGGTKQLAEVGPSGEAILDYTIFDARRAGFERLVLIVRSDIEDLVRDHLARQHGSSLAYEVVLQDRFGPTRAKPWGTAHAVLATADAVPGAFGVVNADDFYGRGALAELATALHREADRSGAVPRHHLVAYRLARTLSPLGTVSRGVCTVDGAGSLRSIIENLAIERDADGRILSRDSGAVLAEDTLVSMNLWGLQPQAFDALRVGWEAFHDAHGQDPKAEFLLPSVIGELVAEGRATVAVHGTDATWVGVTYPGDIDEARSTIARLVADGTYPTPLTPLR